MAGTQYLTLPSGQKMPIIGLGTWEAMDEQELERALDVAFEKGYRHIDTAYAYENEAIIGRVLKKWFASGKIKREDLFITTKLPIFGVHPDRVELFLKKSLSNLQLDYVDLYLIHCPMGAKYNEKTGLIFNADGRMEAEPKTDQAAVWRKMEAQVDAGRAKNIGLSNYKLSQVQEVLKIARIKPANLQIELNVYLQQRELVDFCQKNGVTVVAYSPLGNPGYNKFLARLGHGPKELPNILSDEVIRKISQKHSKTPAQIALRFLIQRGISVVPKSVNPSRIEENKNVFDFKLSEDEMKQLNDLDVGEDARIVDWKVLGGITEHPDYPFGDAQVCKR